MKANADRNRLIIELHRKYLDAWEAGSFTALARRFGVTKQAIESVWRRGTLPEERVRLGRIKSPNGA